MSTGAEFAGHRPHGEDGRPDERYVRILLVEEKTEIADEIRHTLGRTVRASFEVVCQTDLVEAVAQIQGDRFDLLVIDPMLPGVDRPAALELANDLAHRLPVVVLTGTEALREDAKPRVDVEVERRRVSRSVERADVANTLLSAIRRARRLGTGVMTPIFCRLEAQAG